MTPLPHQVDLSVIVLNWNSVQYLPGCLDSIAGAAGEVSYETIVVDAGSYDGSAELIQQRYPSVTFIQLHTNRGYSAGNNEAAAHASGKHLLFLNPDTTLGVGAIRAALAVAKQRADAGAIGACLRNSDGTIQDSAVQAFPRPLIKAVDSKWLRRKPALSHLWGNDALFARPCRVAPVDAVSGAFLMVDTRRFRSVGGFDENYFMYSEDVDLCYRLMRHGWPSYLSHGSDVIHFGGGCATSAPSAFASVMQREATWRFFLKHQGYVCACRYRALILISALTRCAVAMTARMLLCRTRVWTDHDAAALATIKKWSAIMQWTVGRSAIVRSHYNRPGR